MKKIALLLIALAAPLHAEMDGKWAWSTPAIGAWQSLNSADQALGVKEDLWTIHANAQPLCVFGWEFSVTKPMVSSPRDPVRFVGGPTFSVPGSLLDWTLGTPWGQQWLPKAKTGLTAAPDLTRLNAIGVKNTFFGFGITYPVGG
jgi:hypothetical protein